MALVILRSLPLPQPFGRVVSGLHVHHCSTTTVQRRRGHLLRGRWRRLLGRGLLLLGNNSTWVSARVLAGDLGDGHRHRRHFRVYDAFGVAPVRRRRLRATEPKRAQRTKPSRNKKKAKNEKSWVCGVRVQWCCACQWEWKR